jgi:phosphoenolpyruvate-protein kinase (PTS system EI component)
MEREELPSEDEQYEAYRRVVKSSTVSRLSCAP